MASQRNIITTTAPATTEQGSPTVIRALMSPRMRAASEDFATRLMSDKLIEIGTDLSNRTAVRKALRSAKFGERLIENCADRAALEAAH